MTEEEIKLRTKFYLAPKSISIEQLRIMDKEYTNYPGLNREQTQKVYEELKKFKDGLDPDGIAVYRNGVKVTWPK